MAEQRAGMGVDAHGGAVIDPTKNVLDLTAAANKRQDDLRDMHDRYVSAEIRRLEENVKWMEKISDVHQRHDREIHQMEQQKLEAFRKSDETARLTEAERTLAAVQLVARAAETTANDIRAVLNTTASTLANANAARDLEYNNRISALEKSSYEGAGKQAVADPVMAEALAEMKALRLSVVAQQGQGSGQSAGVDKTIKFAVIALGALVSLMTLGGMVIGIAFAIRR